MCSHFLSSIHVSRLCLTIFRPHFVFDYVSTTFRSHLVFGFVLDYVSAILCVCVNHALIASLCWTMPLNSVRLFFDHIFDYVSKICSTERTVFEHGFRIKKTFVCSTEICQKISRTPQPVFYMCFFNC